jgi:glycosyltransferase involved in cell wall biosynthesis
MAQQQNTRRKRLLIITSTYKPANGGLQTYIKDLAGSMDELNRYEIRIITGDQYMARATESSYMIDNIPVQLMRTFAIKGLVFLRSPLSLVKAVRALSRADIVHQHDIKFLTFLVVLCRVLFRYRLYLFSHGYLYHTPRNSRFKDVYMRTFAFLTRCYNGIINISRQDFGKAEEFGFRNNFFINECVKLDKFLAIRKAPRPGHYLYYGRIFENKGLELLFRCLSTIRDQPFRLSIAGKGKADYIARLKSLSADLGLEQHITWEGECEESKLYRLIGEAEIIFLPSLYEGFGITLLESLASNTRVMAHHNTSYTDILKDLELEPLLFDFEDSASFKEKLSVILNADYDLQKNLYKYDHNRMIGQIENLH